MTDAPDSPPVVVDDDPERSRYRLRVGDDLAGTLVYETATDAPAGRARRLLHTRVEPAFEGRGLGSRFIAAVLDDCRTRGLAVLPQCPFVRAYLGRHPSDLDVVPADQRAAYGLPPA